MATKTDADVGSSDVKVETIKDMSPKNYEDENNVSEGKPVHPEIKITDDCEENKDIALEDTSADKKSAKIPGENEDATPDQTENDCPAEEEKGEMHIEETTREPQLHEKAAQFDASYSDEKVETTNFISPKIDEEENVVRKFSSVNDTNTYLDNLASRPETLKECKIPEENPVDAESINKHMPIEVELAEEPLQHATPDKKENDPADAESHRQDVVETTRKLELQEEADELLTGTKKMQSEDEYVEEKCHDETLEQTEIDCSAKEEADELLSGSTKTYVISLKEDETVEHCRGTTPDQTENGCPAEEDMGERNVKEETRELELHEEADGLPTATTKTDAHVGFSDEAGVENQKKHRDNSTIENDQLPHNETLTGENRVDDVNDTGEEKIQPGHELSFDTMKEGEEDKAKTHVKTEREQNYAVVNYITGEVEKLAEDSSTKDKQIICPEGLVPNQELSMQENKHMVDGGEIKTHETLNQTTPLSLAGERPVEESLKQGEWDTSRLQQETEHFNTEDTEQNHEAMDSEEVGTEPANFGKREEDASSTIGSSVVTEANEVENEQLEVVQEDRKEEDPIRGIIHKDQEAEIDDMLQESKNCITNDGILARSAIEQTNEVSAVMNEASKETNEAKEDHLAAQPAEEVETSEVISSKPDGDSKGSNEQELSKVNNTVSHLENSALRESTEKLREDRELNPAKNADFDLIETGTDRCENDDKKPTEEENVEEPKHNATPVQTENDCPAEEETAARHVEQMAREQELHEKDDELLFAATKTDVETIGKLSPMIDTNTCPGNLTPLETIETLAQYNVYEGNPVHPEIKIAADCEENKEVALEDTSAHNESAKKQIPSEDETVEEFSADETPDQTENGCPAEEKGEMHLEETTREPELQERAAQLLPNTTKADASCSDEKVKTTDVISPKIDEEENVVRKFSSVKDTNTYLDNLSSRDSSETLEECKIPEGNPVDAESINKHMPDEVELDEEALQHATPDEKGNDHAEAESGRQDVVETTRELELEEEADELLIGTKKKQMLSEDKNIEEQCQTNENYVTNDDILARSSIEQINEAIKETDKAADKFEIDHLAAQPAEEVETSEVISSKPDGDSKGSNEQETAVGELSKVNNTVSHLENLVLRKSTEKPREVGELNQDNNADFATIETGTDRSENDDKKPAEEQNVEEPKHNATPVQTENDSPKEEEIEARHIEEMAREQELDEKDDELLFEATKTDVETTKAISTKILDENIIGTETIETLALYNVSEGKPMHPEIKIAADCEENKDVALEERSADNESVKILSEDATPNQTENGSLAEEEKGEMHIEERTREPELQENAAQLLPQTTKADASYSDEKKPREDCNVEEETAGRHIEEITREPELHEKDEELLSGARKTDVETSKAISKKIGEDETNTKLDNLTPTETLETSVQYNVSEGKPANPENKTSAGCEKNYDGALEDMSADQESSKIPSEVENVEKQNKDETPDQTEHDCPAEDEKGERHIEETTRESELQEEDDELLFQTTKAGVSYADEKMPIEDEAVEELPQHATLEKTENDPPEGRYVEETTREQEIQEEADESLIGTKKTDLSSVYKKTEHFNTKRNHYAMDSEEVEEINLEATEANEMENEQLEVVPAERKEEDPITEIIHKDQEAEIDDMLQESENYVINDGILTRIAIEQTNEVSTVMNEASKETDKAADKLEISSIAKEDHLSAQPAEKVETSKVISSKADGDNKGSNEQEKREIHIEETTREPELKEEAAQLLPKTTKADASYSDEEVQTTNFISMIDEEENVVRKFSSSNDTNTYLDNLASRESLETLKKCEIPEGNPVDADNIKTAGCDPENAKMPIEVELAEEPLQHVTPDKKENDHAEAESGRQDVVETTRELELQEEADELLIGTKKIPSEEETDEETRQYATLCNKEKYSPAEEEIETRHVNTTTEEFQQETLMGYKFSDENLVKHDKITVVDHEKNDVGVEGMSADTSENAKLPSEDKAVEGPCRDATQHQIEIDGSAEEETRELLTGTTNIDASPLKEEVQTSKVLSAKPDEEENIFGKLSPVNDANTYLFNLKSTESPETLMEFDHESSSITKEDHLAAQPAEETDTKGLELKAKDLDFNMEEKVETSNVISSNADKDIKGSNEQENIVGDLSKVNNIVAHLENPPLGESPEQLREHSELTPANGTTTDDFVMTETGADRRENNDKKPRENCNVEEETARRHIEEITREPELHEKDDELLSGARKNDVETSKAISTKIGEDENITGKLSPTKETNKKLDNITPTETLETLVQYNVSEGKPVISENQTSAGCEKNTDLALEDLKADQESAKIPSEDENVEEQNKDEIPDQTEHDCPAEDEKGERHIEKTTREAELQEKDDELLFKTTKAGVSYADEKMPIEDEAVEEPPELVTLEKTENDPPEGRYVNETSREQENQEEADESLIGRKKTDLSSSNNDEEENNTGKLSLVNDTNKAGTSENSKIPSEDENIEEQCQDETLEKREFNRSSEEETRERHAKEITRELELQEDADADADVGCKTDADVGSSDEKVETFKDMPPKNYEDENIVHKLSEIEPAEEPLHHATPDKKENDPEEAESDRLHVVETSRELELQEEADELLIGTKKMPSEEETVEEPHQDTTLCNKVKYSHVEEEIGTRHENTATEEFQQETLTGYKFSDENLVKPDKITVVDHEKNDVGVEDITVDTSENAKLSSEDKAVEGPCCDATPHQIGIDGSAEEGGNPINQDSKINADHEKNDNVVPEDMSTDTSNTSKIQTSKAVFPKIDEEENVLGNLSLVNDTNTYLDSQTSTIAPKTLTDSNVSEGMPVKLDKITIADNEKNIDVGIEDMSSDTSENTKMPSEAQTVEGISMDSTLHQTDEAGSRPDKEPTRELVFPEEADDLPLGTTKTDAISLNEKIETSTTNSPKIYEEGNDFGIASQQSPEILMEHDTITIGDQEKNDNANMEDMSADTGDNAKDIEKQIPREDKSVGETCRDATVDQTGKVMSPKTDKESKVSIDQENIANECQQESNESTDNLASRESPEKSIEYSVFEGSPANNTTSDKEKNNDVALADVNPLSLVESEKPRNPVDEFSCNSTSLTKDLNFEDQEDSAEGEDNHKGEEIKRTGKMEDHTVTQLELKEEAFSKQNETSSEVDIIEQQNEEKAKLPTMTSFHAQDENYQDKPTETEQLRRNVQAEEEQLQSDSSSKIVPESREVKHEKDERKIDESKNITEKCLSMESDPILKSSLNETSKEEILQASEVRENQNPKSNDNKVDCSTGIETKKLSKDTESQLMGKGSTDGVQQEMETLDSLYAFKPVLGAKGNYHKDDNFIHDCNMKTGELESITCPQSSASHLKQSDKEILQEQDKEGSMDEPESFHVSSDSHELLTSVGSHDGILNALEVQKPKEESLPNSSSSTSTNVLNLHQKVSADISLFEEDNKEQRKFVQDEVISREVDIKPKSEQISVKEEFEDRKTKAAESEGQKTDQDEGKCNEETKVESADDIPVKVEAPGPSISDDKSSQKKSHNILSGVGSKMKHSIARVKKVITGKHSNQKPHST